VTNNQKEEHVLKTSTISGSEMRLALMGAKMLGIPQQQIPQLGETQPEDILLKVFDGVERVYSFVDLKSRSEALVDKLLRRAMMFDVLGWYQVTKFINNNDCQCGVSAAVYLSQMNADLANGDVFSLEDIILLFEETNGAQDALGKMLVTIYDQVKELVERAQRSFRDMEELELSVNVEVRKLSENIKVKPLQAMDALVREINNRLLNYDDKLAKDLVARYIPAILNGQDSRIGVGRIMRIDSVSRENAVTYGRQTPSQLPPANKALLIVIRQFVLRQRYRFINL
jgi:hypothetical protein